MTDLQFIYGEAAERALLASGSPDSDFQYQTIIEDAVRRAVRAEIRLRRSVTEPFEPLYGVPFGDGKQIVLFRVRDAPRGFIITVCDVAVCPGVRHG